MPMGSLVGKPKRIKLDINSDDLDVATKKFVEAHPAFDTPEAKKFMDDYKKQIDQQKDDEVESIDLSYQPTKPLSQTYMTVAEDSTPIQKFLFEMYYRVGPDETGIYAQSIPGKPLSGPIDVESSASKLLKAVSSSITDEGKIGTAYIRQESPLSKRTGGYYKIVKYETKKIKKTVTVKGKPQFEWIPEWKGIGPPSPDDIGSFKIKLSTTQQVENIRKALPPGSELKYTPYNYGVNNYTQSIGTLNTKLTNLSKGKVVYDWMRYDSPIQMTKRDMKRVKEFVTGTGEFKAMSPKLRQELKELIGDSPIFQDKAKGKDGQLILQSETSNILNPVLQEYFSNPQIKVVQLLGPEFVGSKVDDVTRMSYGVITKKAPNNQKDSFMTVKEVKPEIEKLVDTIKSNPDLEFVLSPIGTKRGGFEAKEIVPLLGDDIVDQKNVILPRSFYDVLSYSQKLRYNASRGTSIESRILLGDTDSFTPEKVTSLKENQVFVYGANKDFKIYGGAASDADKYFGAGREGKAGIVKGLVDPETAVPETEIRILSVTRKGQKGPEGQYIGSTKELIESLRLFPEDTENIGVELSSLSPVSDVRNVLALNKVVKAELIRRAEDTESAGLTGVFSSRGDWMPNQGKGYLFHDVTSYFGTAAKEWEVSDPLFADTFGQQNKWSQFGGMPTTGKTPTWRKPKQIGMGADYSKTGLKKVGGVLKKVERPVDERQRINVFMWFGTAEQQKKMITVALKDFVSGKYMSYALRDEFAQKKYGRQYDVLTASEKKFVDNYIKKNPLEFSAIQGG